MKILSILILSIIAGILYRMGGKGGKWYFNTKMRDIGCSIITILSLFILKIFVPFWAYLFTFGLSWAACAAYWQMDEHKWGFWPHGLGLSLATLPIAYITGHWWGFSIRCIIFTTLITLWSEFWGDVNIEEGGRGALIILTLPLLLIGG